MDIEEQIEEIQEAARKNNIGSNEEELEVRFVVSKIIRTQQKEIEKLEEDLAIYKGVSEGKDIIIKQLEEEIRMLKQYAEISKNDKQHRKKRLNKALEEIKQLKNK